jgi:hypothetical protein
MVRNINTRIYAMDMNMNMNTLTSQIKNLTVTSTSTSVFNERENALVNDMSIIIECWMRCLGHLETPGLLVRANAYSSTPALYGAVVKALGQTSMCLIEIMPYIDDYLEYYEKLSA